MTLIDNVRRFERAFWGKDAKIEVLVEGQPCKLRCIKNMSAADLQYCKVTMYGIPVKFADATEMGAGQRKRACYTFEDGFPHHDGCYSMMPSDNIAAKFALYIAYNSAKDRADSHARLSDKEKDYLKKRFAEKGF